MVEKETIKYPIECHEKCPDCGSADGLGGQAIQQLKGEGKLSAAAFPKGLMIQTMLLDPGKFQMALTPMIDVPILEEYYEICAVCKKRYTKKVDLNHKQIPNPFLQIGNQSRPKFNLKGN